MKKRILSLVLVIVMMLSIIPLGIITAGAASDSYTIERVDVIGIGTPVIGKLPSTIETAKCSTDGVIIQKVVWAYYDEKWEWVNMPAGSTFESGKRYAVIVEFKHEDGYAFTSDKSDMTVYVNGKKSTVNVAYSSDFFGVTLEFVPVTTPAFTTQPEDCEVFEGAVFEVNWEFNFTPAKTVLVTFTPGPGGALTELGANVTSADLGASPEGGYYQIRGYYNDDEFVYSDKFHVTEVPFVNNYQIFFLEEDSETVMFSQTVQEGDTLTKPADPVKEGYEFIGWYTDDGELFDFSTPITSKFVLTATFKPITEVIIMVNGVEMEVGDYLAVGATAPTKTKPASVGYVYLGIDSDIYHLDVYDYVVDCGENNFIVEVKENLQLALSLHGESSVNTNDVAINLPTSYPGIFGDGTLNITSKDTGIVAGNFYMESGALNINSGSDGIYCYGNVAIVGGSLCVPNSDCCAIHMSNDSGDNYIAIDGGYVYLKGSEDGIYFNTHGNLYVEGGCLFVDVAGVAVMDANIFISDNIEVVNFIGGSGAFYDNCIYSFSDVLEITVATDTEGNDVVDMSQVDPIDVKYFEAIPKSGIYIGEAFLTAGQYLAENSTIPTTTKPSGGYAYLEKVDGEWVLTLNNFDLVSPEEYYAIYSENDLTIKLLGTNTLEDTYTPDGYTVYVYGGDLTIEGTGKLTVVGNEYDSIYVEYGNFIMNSGTLILDAADDGLYVDEGDVTINGGDLQVASGDDAVYVYGAFYMNGGTVTITEAYCCGIDADNFYMTDGEVIISDDEGQTDGLYIDGDIDISGGKVYVDVYYRAFCCGELILANCYIELYGEEQAIDGDYYDIAADLNPMASVNIDGSSLEIFDPERDNGFKYFTCGSTYAKGDVNGDGKVNLFDYVAVKSHVLGKSTLPEDQQIRADLNGDGRINMFDYVALKSQVIKG